MLQTSALPTDHADLVTGKSHPVSSHSPLDRTDTDHTFRDTFEIRRRL